MGSGAGELLYFLHTNEYGEDDLLRPPIFMDEQLWPRLPHDLLLNRILVRLPLPSLLSFRLVCKRWHHLLSSPPFLLLCSQSSHPWLIRRPLSLSSPTPPSNGRIASPLLPRPHMKRLINFTPPQHLRPPPPGSSTPLPGFRWSALSLEFLPCEVCRRGYPFFLSSDGLVLIVHIEDRGCKFVVCNPLTRTWRDLGGPPHYLCGLLAAIVVDSASKCYKVVVAGRSNISNSQLTSYVFDSTTECWKEISDLPPLPRFKEMFLRPSWTNKSDGIVYWLTPCATIVMYNVRLEIWSTLQTNWPSGLVLPFVRQIWESKGCLLMVAILNGMVGIWQLRPTETLWNKVATLPREASRVIIEYMREIFECVKLGNVLCFGFFHSSKVLMYHITSTTWQWSPECLYSNNLTASFSFEPRLDALV